MAQNAAAGVNHGEGLGLPETWSGCVTERGADNFEVTNCALLVVMGAGSYVSSSTFCVGGYDWSIRFYPAGASNAAGYASAFLYYLSETKNVRAKWTTTMLDKDGQGCVVTVIKEPPPDQCKEKPFEIPPPELPGQLERVLKDGKGADVTILVGGREFSAHRFMLAARSPVFDAQLFGPLAEKGDTRCAAIEVVDMEPVIFEMLLHFIYADSLPPCDGEEGYGAAEMQHLLVAADRYGLDRLKAMCEEKLCKTIDARHELKNACEEFMSKPGRASMVMVSDGFRRLVARCIPLVLEHK
ncbi:hypothetical protein BRADI_5g22503v3 [Brachypodium distachyon]|uniref:BTB domain-containing protein n=1 Tax=Brachypodium distachyon TaxID=15368 RepID=A0A0Q3EA60_BRADI|nr:hypothetical protein BRADI_5g22503v3 [Brachypodium distachyon]